MPRGFQPESINDYKYPSSIGLNYARALSALGFDVDYHCINLPNSGKLENTSRFKAGIVELHFKYWQLISRIPLLGSRIFVRGPVGKSLIRKVNETRADVLLVCNINAIPPLLASRFFNKPRLIAGMHSSPIPPLSWLEPYSIIFSALPSMVKHFRDLGFQSEFLPLAFEPGDNGEQPKAFVERKLDVSFVGTLNRHFVSSISLFKLVARFLNLNLYSHSNSFKFRLLGLGPAFRGPASSPQDVYSDSKIVLNRHVKLATGYSANLRMYEATASGAVLLTEESRNLGELFEPGVEVVTYKNAGDAVRKITELLRSPKLAQEIASAGHRRLLREHTYRSRAITLHHKLLNAWCSLK